MRVAGLVPEAGDGRSHGFDAATIIGASSIAGVQFAGSGPDAGNTVEVAILCRQPDPSGSVRAAPATRRACRWSTRAGAAPPSAARCEEPAAP